MDVKSADIDALICQAVLDTTPIRPCEVTETARKAVEKRLYNFPLHCEQLEQAKGLDALLLTHEVERMKRVLKSISDDPYYSIIPARYFHGAKERVTAKICACDPTTVWRVRRRLLDTLAVKLFGVEAWGEMRSL